MTRTTDHLPDGPALLKAMLLEQQQAHEQEVAHLRTVGEQEIARLRSVSEQEIARLREQIHLLLHKRFGASSEKHNADQLGLFNEAEQVAADEVLAEAVDTAGAEIQVPAHRRKKRGRQPLPSSTTCRNMNSTVPVAATPRCTVSTKRSANSSTSSRPRFRCCCMSGPNTPAASAKPASGPRRCRRNRSPAASPARHCWPISPPASTRTRCRCTGWKRSCAGRLIETAKANGLEPFAYLKTVFSQLPAADSVEAMEALLPWKVSAD